MLNFLNKGISSAWGITIIVIVSGIFIGLLQIYFSKISELYPVEILIQGLAAYNCETAYRNIEADFEKANFCENDNDCKAMEIGMFVQFGCYKFVNVNTQEQTFYDKMTEYYQHCNAPVDDCVLLPESVCVNNRCAPKTEE